MAMYRSTTLKLVRSVLGCVAAGAAVLSFSSAASAALLVHEDFNYNVAPQSLNGENGGVGYTAAYLSTSNGDIVAGSFGYTDSAGRTLVTSGNRAYLDSTTVGATKPNTAPAAERVSVAPNRNIVSLASGGSTIYISFLAQQTAGTGRDISVSLFTVANETYGTQERLSIGHGNQSAANPLPTTGDSVHWGAYTNAVGHLGAYSSTPSNELALLVARIDVNVNGALDRFRLYVNPSLGEEPTVASAESSDYDFLSALDTINRVRMRAGGSNDSYGASQMEVDEIRIGTTYADVTPSVPEPSSALLGAAALALLGVRRRR
jgi:MYXO-CTERM domain-containing protein